MKKIASLLILCIAVSLLCIAANAETLETGTLLRPGTADPWMFYDGGKYYLTRTGSTRVAVYESENLADLYDMSTEKNISYIGYYGDYTDPAVYELFGDGATIDGTWSPEIHYFSEEEFPGNGGWYMFVGLRRETGDSSMVRMVVLKSTTDSPLGPYGHPTKGTENYSQPVLNVDGDIYDEWACGQTVLRIAEGEYAGIYTMWVAEEGRGQSGADGKFYQKIMIAKMSSPWQLAGEPAIITTPTQEWEQASGSSTHPQVVEGATPVYGRNGDVFLVYSGSGYWTNYALGQLTWTGDDPLLTSSWVKLDESKNPILDASTSTDLRGAGHASFLTDTNGNGFAVYHAYPYEDGTKASSRNAYIEPYYIDYTEENGAGKGVVHIGLKDNGVTAPTTSAISFATDGTALTAPTVTAAGDTSAVSLTMSAANADGYTIYRSADGETFAYLATAGSGTYTDTDVTAGSTYYYRAYALREEEISSVSETASATAVNPIAAPTLSVYPASTYVYTAMDLPQDYDDLVIYRSTDGKTYEKHLGGFATGYTSGMRVNFYDYDVTEGVTYYYYACGIVDEAASDPSNICSITYTSVAAPEITAVSAKCDGITLTFSDSYSKFAVLRSTDGKSFDRMMIATGNTYTDSNVTLGQTYYYYAKGSVDGNYIEESNTVSATVAHIVSTVEGKDATCTDDGYTSSTVCSHCGTTLTPSETIPASHSYEVTEAGVPATTASEGKTAVYTCTVCGSSYGGEVIPMLETIMGDASGDGKLTLVDLLRVVKAISGKITVDMSVADMNADGALTVADAMLIIYAYLD